MLCTVLQCYSATVLQCVKSARRAMIGPVLPLQWSTPLLKWIRRKYCSSWSTSSLDSDVIMIWDDDQSSGHPYWQSTIIILSFCQNFQPVFRITIHHHRLYRLYWWWPWPWWWERCCISRGGSPQYWCNGSSKARNLYKVCKFCLKSYLQLFLYFIGKSVPIFLNPI